MWENLPLPPLPIFIIMNSLDDRDFFLPSLYLNVHNFYRKKIDVSRRKNSCKLSKVSWRHAYGEDGMRFWAEQGGEDHGEE